MTKLKTRNRIRIAKIDRSADMKERNEDLKHLVGQRIVSATIQLDPWTGRHATVLTFDGPAELRIPTDDWSMEFVG